jgi:membrane fusion protein (multidrug efflux system)
MAVSTRCKLILLTLMSICSAVFAAEGIPVTVAVVAEQQIHRQLSMTGTVTAARASQLSTAVSGLVSILKVDAGDRVTRGEVLLELDPELARLQVLSSEAQLQQARKALADARRRLEEARRLAPQRSIAESVVRDLEAEVDNDDSAVQQAEADTAYRQGILSRHQLKAPYTGVVSAKLTELGEWVTPGQAVLGLVAIDDVRLDFLVAEDYLADMSAGASLSFSLSAAPDRVYQGKVATVMPVTDPNARTFLLRVLPDSPSRSMIPGMSVSAKLNLATGRSGLVVPRDAILRFPDGRVVAWIVENQPSGPVVREKVVTTGVAADAMVEIRQGLIAGEQVVVQGNETLQDGQPVLVLPSQPGR